LINNGIESNSKINPEAIEKFSAHNKVVPAHAVTATDI